MRHTTLIVMLQLALTIASSSLHAQTQITSCNSEFIDVGGDAENYLDNENSDWLICPDTLTEYLELEFTHVNIETAADAGVDSTGCMDVLYIYDGLDDTAPMLGSFCGEDSGSGKNAYIVEHTLRVGDSFKPTNSSGCFYVKFISNSTNRFSGWRAEVNCCVPSLSGGMTDGIDLPLSTNGGNFFNIEIDNGCVRSGKLEMFTDFEGEGSSCFTSGLSQPNRSFYAFDSNPTGGFVELLAAPVDSVGIIEMLVFGPVVLDSLSYTGGVINDCVFGETPWSTFFNAGPNQTYILAIATELKGRTSIDVLPSTQGLGGVLPVSMTDYSISKVRDEARVSWTTAQEINNAGFEIFRSLDGKQFESVGWVDAKLSSENSKTYSFKDNPGVASEVYYFVRQLDLNGVYQDHDVLSVRFRDDKKVSIFPNPSHGVVNVVIDENQVDAQANIFVFDQLGKLKYSNMNYNGNGLDLHSLSAGLYTIQVVYDSEVFSLQHVIEK